LDEVEVEGVAIANLIGTDEQTVVGWVYCWNTGALAVRWGVNGPQRVSMCQPNLSYAQKREIDFARLKRIRRSGNARG